MIDDELVYDLFNFTLEDFIDIMDLTHTYHYSQVMLDFLLILKGIYKYDNL